MKHLPTPQMMQRAQTKTQPTRPTGLPVPKWFPHPLKHSLTRAIYPMLICAILAILSSVGQAQVSLRKIGEPIFNLTGGLVNLPIGNPNNLDIWEENIERFLDDALPEHYFESDDWKECFSCPLAADDGAYDQEFQKSLVEQGIVLTDAFLLEDLAYPTSLWFHSVLTPNSNAPEGPSFDNSNGPILPSKIFPLERSTIEWKANGGTFFNINPRQYDALDREALQYTDDEGTTHELDYTGLNYSHLHVTMGIHSPSVPSGFVSNEMGQVGNHQAMGTVLDRDGNGWEITSRITVVAEPTDVVGDLNFNGELDMGDYNIMTQNVAHMPIEGHSPSEAQLRLDLNGDQVVNAEDTASLLSLFPAPEAISLTVGETYHQNFDSLGSGGAADATLPTAWAVTDQYGASRRRQTNVAFPTSRSALRSSNTPFALNTGVSEGDTAADRSLAIYRQRDTDPTAIQLLADTDVQADALQIEFSVEAWDRIRSTAGNRDGGEAAFDVTVEIDSGDGTSDMSKIVGGDFAELVNLGVITTGADLPLPDGDFLDGNDLAHRVSFTSDIIHADIPAGSRLRFRWETTSEADASEEWIFGVDDVSITLALAGDSNLDGEVKFDDFLALSANFGESGGWEHGDFDGDGMVGFPDFLTLSKNFGGAANTSAAAVPEPTAASLALFGLLGLIGFRKRR